MLGIAFAGVSALLWGTSDFCGGLAVRHGSQHALRVTVFSHLWGIPVVLLGVLMVPGTFGREALLWGGLAGVVGVVSVALLYQALSEGTMAVVAPVSAVTAAAIPALGGVLLGERPSPVALSGVALALLAIAFLTSTQSEPPIRVAPRNLVLTGCAGGSCGLFYLLLGQAGAGSGMWPLASEAFVSIAAGAILLGMIPSARARSGGSIAALACLAGLLDAAATGLYVFATQHGQLSLVAPIAALDPASTVLLALAIAGERLRPMQMGGLAFAALALVLTAS